MESMCVASGCGCKEVYRFPHITYPYSSCICSVLQQHPYFLFIKKIFFVHTYRYLKIQGIKELQCSYTATTWTNKFLSHSVRVRVPPVRSAPQSFMPKASMIPSGRSDSPY